MVRGERLLIVEYGQTCACPANSRIVLAMPKLILTCVVLALLFCLLCGPVSYVALRFWRNGDFGALRPLRAVWLAQLVLAAALVFVADEIGLHNPIGYVLAIVLAVSLLGAAVFGLWRLMLQFARR
jgi:hypothetical protein